MLYIYTNKKSIIFSQNFKIRTDFINNPYEIKLPWNLHPIFTVNKLASILLVLQINLVEHSLCSNISIHRPFNIPNLLVLPCHVSPIKPWMKNTNTHPTSLHLDTLQFPSHICRNLTHMVSIVHVLT